MIITFPIPSFGPGVAATQLWRRRRGGIKFVCPSERSKLKDEINF